MCAASLSNPMASHEGYIPLETADLFYREIGVGQPIIILHGGPDFDHSYLLPELDRLCDSFRLIYYDQRGRGKSAAGVLPEDVTIQSDVEDAERVREHFQLDSIAVLGHSWGGVLAMEYATRYANRLSHLILLDTAPASHDDYKLLREELPRKRAAADIERMDSLRSTSGYTEGDPDIVAEYYRYHFKPTLRSLQHLEKVVQTLRASFTKEGVLKAREIEKRLMDETWLASDFNLLPRLQHLNIPALILHGDYDFIPVECIAPIVQALPDALFRVLEDCGHFSFLEFPEEVHKEITEFFQRT